MSNITELQQVRISAVPAVPKEISATQRLAALHLAQMTEEYLEIHDDEMGIYAAKLMRDASRLLRELAK